LLFKIPLKSCILLTPNLIFCNLTHTSWKKWMKDFSAGMRQKLKEPTKPIIHF